MRTYSYPKMKVAALKAAHHFELLGVHLGSTPEELTAARRALAKIFHPDVNGDPAAAGIMAAVNAAYDVLADDKRRRVYAQCVGPKCGACKALGYTKKQQGFTKTILTVCQSCKGAGHVNKL